MRVLRISTALTVAALFGAAGLASVAKGERLVWVGTLSVEIYGFEPVSNIGTGVATVDPPPVNKIRIENGLTLKGTANVVPPAATLTPIFPAFTMEASLGTATLSGFQAGPPLTKNVLPLRGLWKFCVLSPSCVSFIPLDLTVNGTRGVGIGGIITVGSTGTGTVAVRISLEAAPWTFGTARVTGLPTLNGGETTLTETGFAMGPATSGGIRLVSPVMIDGTLETGDPLAFSVRKGGFGILTLHFVPEPGFILLLGSGAVGLAIMGRKRAKK